MPIRKLTLEEWFLKYQLRSIRERHFHLPFELDLDLTKTVEAWKAAHAGGGTPPYTALLVKALAMLARELPYVNRMVFSTFYGPRMVEFDYVTVNVPVVLDAAGRPHLSATMVPDADRLPLDEIRARISEARKRDPSKLRIARLFVANRNTFLNRLKLRLIHFLVYNFPSLYVKKGGGGLTVSSLLNHTDAAFNSRPYAYGSTAFTLCACSVSADAANRLLLKVGVGYDHYAFAGNEGVGALKRLWEILTGRDPAALAELIK